MLAIIGEKNEDISSYLDKKDSKQKNNTTNSGFKEASGAIVLKTFIPNRINKKNGKKLEEEDMLNLIFFMIKEPNLESKQMEG